LDIEVEPEDQTPPAEFTVEQEVSVENLVGEAAHGSVRNFLVYWLGLRRGRRMPAFKDIDPVDIPWALSRTFVADVLPGPSFRYRLAGEDFSRRYGCSLKGLSFGDFMEAQSAKLIEQRWCYITQHRLAFYVVTDHPSKNGLPVVGQRLMLPLSDDDDRVDQLFGYTYFYDPDNYGREIARRHFLKSMTWAKV